MKKQVVNLTAFSLIMLLAVTLLFGLAGCFSSTPASSQGGPSYPLEINLLGKTGQFTLDSQGRLKSIVQLSSADGRIGLFMNSGTKVLDKDNKPLQLINATVDSQPPLLPENTDVLGAVYDLTPAGVQFNPAIQLTIAYDIKELPEGARESDLYVASYQDGGWNALRYKKVSTDSHKITTTIDHCSKFAVLLALQEPAAASTPAVISSSPSSPNALKVVVAGYMNHGPLQPTVRAIKEVLAKYGDKVAVTWVDLGTKDGVAYFKEHGLTAHMNVIINDQYKYQVNGKAVTFQWFEGQQWTKQDLDTVLASLIRAYIFDAGLKFGECGYGKNSI